MPKRVAGCAICSVCGRRCAAFRSRLTGELRVWMHGFRSRFVEGYQTGRYCLGYGRAGAVFGQPKGAGR